MINKLLLKYGKLTWQWQIVLAIVYIVLTLMLVNTGFGLLSLASTIGNLAGLVIVIALIAFTITIFRKLFKLINTK